MVEAPIGCPFCHSLEKPVLENDYARAFFSDPRKVPGHMLVMPKRHIEKPWELRPEELAAIFAIIFVIEEKLLDNLGTGCDIRQNYRPFAKQDKLKLNHLTFHVLPRSANDYLYKVSEKYEEDIFAELDDAERTAVTKLLQS